MDSTKVILSTLALALFAPIGCDNDDGDDDMTPRDAEIGWTAMNHAVHDGHDGFAAQVDLSVDGELHAECEGGGSMHLVGRMNELDDFRIDVSFDQCVADDTMIDGAVTLVARVDVDVDIDDDDGEPDHAGAAVIVDYDGLLEFDGEVEGTCSIDASVRAGAVVFDGFAAAGVTVQGHICDNEADVVVGGHVVDDDDDDGQAD